MTEGGRQEESGGGTKGNIGDEFEEATGRRRDRKDDASEEATPGDAAGSGGVKDNVQDDFEQTQRD